MRIINNCAESIEARFRRLKNYYDQNPANNLNIAVWHCYFWNGMTYRQTADILDVFESRVRTEVDILMQGAQ